ncbi:MAG: response regulator [Verrucomicrobia bacterium]|nr:response regulator [Verrucomicrobiota bacterium]
MKRKLLFVEDDIITGAVYRFHFASAGYHVEVATNGEAAIEALGRFKPDIVVLDLLLPKINGVEVLKRMRANPETAAVPVVVFTNVYASELGTAAQAAGANRCLNKANTNYASLLEVVREVLESAAAEQEILSARAEAGTGSGASALLTPAEIRLDPREEFLQRTPKILADARGLVQDLRKAPSDEIKAGLILELARKVHFLTALAALGQAQLLAEVASALEVLLNKLNERLDDITESTLRTIQQTSDLLGLLFDRASSDLPEDSASRQILVVDDDAVSRKLIGAALQIAQLKAVTLDDPNEAYERLQKDRFDLVITDVRMPGISGFELCEKLRALPGRSRTPVIFVTAASDFASRVRSAQSGRGDFIAKPFLAIELAVKALGQLLNAGLQNPLPSFQPFHPQT